MKMSGRLFSDSRNSNMLLKNLMESVKEVQNSYGKNKTLLATEKDVRYASIFVYVYNSRFYHIE